MIEVQRTGPETFTVRIREAKGQTRHEVTLTEADCARLGGHDAETTVVAAFRFLLDREPKESILARFDLMVIARYFPEFERALASYFTQR